MADLLKKIINVSTKDMPNKDFLAQADALEEAAKEIEGMQGQLLQEAYLLRLKDSDKFQDGDFKVIKDDGFVRITNETGRNLIYLPKKVIKKLDEADLTEIALEIGADLPEAQQLQLENILRDIAGLEAK